MGKAVIFFYYPFSWILIHFFGIPHYKRVSWIFTGVPHQETREWVIFPSGQILGPKIWRHVNFRAKNY